MTASDGAHALGQQLRDIFGSRLRSVVVYRAVNLAPDAPLHTLATVETLQVNDLRACAQRAASWHVNGLATPLVIPVDEFARALDAFPLEFGAILADHDVIVGDDPFAGLQVREEDARRACEVQVRSHLLHLREGFIETRGRGDALVDLIADSAAPLAGLVMSVARLLGLAPATPQQAAEAVEHAARLPVGGLVDVLKHTPTGAEHARVVFGPYLTATEQLSHFVDRWSRA
ncbi:MAG: hypothetical protein AB7N65_23490 [Vicinamibacterales bacterium]